jgi:hypothetical protein
MLTKSLHTVTAARNLGAHLMSRDSARASAKTPAQRVDTAIDYAQLALSILGHHFSDADMQVAITCDVTVRRAVVALYSILSGEGDRQSNADVSALVAMQNASVWRDAKAIASQFYVD